MNNNYYEDNLVRLTGTYRNRVTGAVADPTTVTFKVTDPNSATTTYVYGTDAQLVKDSTGVYHVDLSLDLPGLYYYRFLGTGAVKAAGQKVLNVLAGVPA